MNKIRLSEIGPHFKHALADNRRSTVGYLLTGLIAFLTDYSIFLLVISLSDWIFFANAAGLLSGFVVSFVGNKYFVFGQGLNRSQEQALSTPMQLAWYLGLLSFNTILSYSVIVAIIWLGSSAMVGKLISMLLIVIWNYFAYKKLIFAIK